MRTSCLKTTLICLLGLLASCGKSSGEWAAELTSRDPFVRGMAAIGLGMQDPANAKAALPVLLKTIDRSDVGLEQQAAQVLFMMGPFHVPSLLQMMVDDPLMSFDSMGTIKNALVAAGPKACDSIIECLSGPGLQLAGDLGDILLGIGPAALPSLIQLLQQGEQARLQNFAAFLIGKMGPQARTAIPALQQATKSEDQGLRESAMRALTQVQSRTANTSSKGRMK